ncbi:uncharacterized protein [Montipora capricornis]|uniref:uncharacterized protein n=1 Tax=Montipora capricornis TaxID=246305 RepID=UPI0035F19DA7
MKVILVISIVLFGACGGFSNENDLLKDSRELDNGAVVVIMKPCDPGRRSNDTWFWWNSTTNECFWCRCLVFNKAWCQNGSLPSCSSCHDLSILTQPCCQHCHPATSNEISIPIKRRNFPEDVDGI